MAAAIAVAGLAAMLTACSPVAFPSLTANPMPRADDPLTPDDVQEATTNLLNDRTKLGNQATAAQASAVAAGMSQPPAPAAGAAAKP